MKQRCPKRSYILHAAHGTTIWISPLAAKGSASVEDIERICKEFGSVSAMWSKLAVGEAMILIWRPSPGSKSPVTFERQITLAFAEPAHPMSGGCAKSSRADLGV